jgi:hypothetical protein
MCEGYIHDLLLSPLSIKSHLRQHIHLPSLKKHSYEIVSALMKIVTLFPDDKDIFDINDYEYPNLQMAIKNNDQQLLEHIISVILWIRFELLYPSIYSELQYIVTICLDASIARKTKHPEELIKEFLIYKVHSLLSVISDIHTAHIKKEHLETPGSSGPVPQEKLNELRRAAGLYVEPIQTIPSIPSIITINTYLSSTSDYLYDELYS